MTRSSSPALTLRHVSKHFGGVTALNDVSLRLEKGEILGLVGENGSGKSTLMKILTGYHHPDRGAVGELWGHPLSFPVGAADHLGIVVIHQDLGLVDSMTVLENLGVADGYGARIVGGVNWRREEKRCANDLARFGLSSVSPGTLVGALAPTERATIAILRAFRALEQNVGTDGRIFILDEPTAYLTTAESERIMALMKTVVTEGSSVIFISHHLKEVVEIADRVTVLRDGQVVGDLSNRGLTERQIISLMLGRELERFYPERVEATTTGTVLLEASQLSGKIVTDLSFEVRAGEILGVTGLAGMGQQELPYLLSGTVRPASGVIRACGGEITILSPADARRAGVVLVPGNRGRDGLWPLASASENISLPFLRQYFEHGRLNRKREKQRSHDLMRQFGVVPSNEDMSVRAFSGGNQQKIVLAKWLQEMPQTLLLDEPTQGVDAGARREIMEIVRTTAMNGAAAAIFSSDLEQLANVCTRVIVLSRGRLATTLHGAAATEDALLSACQTM